MKETRKTRIEWDFLLPCPYCDGEGEIEWEEFFPFSETSANPVEVSRREKCYACNGTGIAKIITCVPCETMIKIREHRLRKLEAIIDVDDDDDWF